MRESSQYFQSQVISTNSLPSREANSALFSTPTSLSSQFSTEPYNISTTLVVDDTKDCQNVEESNFTPFSVDELVDENQPQTVFENADNFLE
jgi:histone acetyltransferase (RNA polymerase elongator complex component)